MRSRPGIFLGVAAVLLCVAPVASAQGDPTEAYVERLGDLVRDYGSGVGEAPSFDDPRFNRILSYSRRAVDKAERQADRGGLEESAWWLARAVASAESATKAGDAAGISGTGFSDDLASFGSFIVLSLFDDLVAESFGEAPRWATEYFMDLSAEAHDLHQDGKFNRAARLSARGITWALWFR